MDPSDGLDSSDTLRREYMCREAPLASVLGARPSVENVPGCEVCEDIIIVGLQEVGRMPVNRVYCSRVGDRNVVGRDAHEYAYSKSRCQMLSVQKEG